MLDYGQLRSTTGILELARKGRKLGRAVRPPARRAGRFEMSTEYAAYATKATSPTMTAFADWLIPEGVDEASFRKGVALGGSTRGYFQKSEAWKADSRNYLANVESRRAERDAERAAKAEAALAKAVERAKATKAAAVASAKAAAAKAGE